MSYIPGASLLDSLKINNFISEVNKVFALTSSNLYVWIFMLVYVPH